MNPWVCVFMGLRDKIRMHEECSRFSFINRSIIFYLFIIFLVSLSIPDVLAGSPTALPFTGVITGHCAHGSTIEVNGWVPGSFRSGAPLDSFTMATVAGAPNVAIFAGQSLTYDSDFGGLDVEIIVTNPACSNIARNEIVRLATNDGTAADMEILVDFSATTPGNNSQTAVNLTQLIWTDAYNGINYHLVVDDNNDFSSPVIDTILGGTSYTSPTELPFDTYYWYVEADDGSVFDSTGIMNFDLNEQIPVISGFSPSTAWKSDSTTQNISFDTDIKSECRYALTGGVAFAGKVAFGTDVAGLKHNLSIELFQGANNIYVQCESEAGSRTGDELYTVNVDTIAPSHLGASVLVDGGNTTSIDGDLNLEWSGFLDTTSGIRRYHIDFVNGSGNATSSLQINSPSLTGSITTAGQGNINVYVWAEDVAGNIGYAVYNSIIVDSQPPIVGLYSTNPGNLVKNSETPFTVYITASDASGFSQLPRIRYKIGNQSVYGSYQFMSAITGRYVGSIDEDWLSNAGKTIYYEINVIGSDGRETNLTGTEYIDEIAIPPILYPISSITVNQASRMNISLSATDVDTQILTFLVNDSRISIRSTGDKTAEATWTPTNEDVGIHMFNFSVTDGSKSRSDIVVVAVNNINDAPQFITTGNFYAYEYIPFNYTLEAIDIDGDEFTFASNLSFFNPQRRTGSIYYYPQATERGDHNFNLSVIDEYGAKGFYEGILTVQYCGDNQCSENIEDEDNCEIDCGIKGSSEDVAGFLISQRNCLGEDVQISAYKLTSRATCDNKGMIIRGHEACGMKANTEVIVKKMIDGGMVEIASLLTNDDGEVTYTTEEEGRFLVSYTNTAYSDYQVYFTVKQCGINSDDELVIDDEKSTDLNASIGEPSFDDGQEPYFEQPGVPVIKMTLGRKIALFGFLPLILVALLFSGGVMYYHSEQINHPQNEFVRFINRLNLKIISIVNIYKKKTKKTATGKILIDFVDKFILKTRKFKQNVLKTLQPLFYNKQLQIPYYMLRVKNEKDEQTMMLLSILRYAFPYEDFEKLINAVTDSYQNKSQNLRLLALSLSSLGLKMQYLFSTAKKKDELLNLHKKSLVVMKKSYPTIIDIKLQLLLKRPVVVPLVMKTLNSTAPKKTFYSLVTGMNKKGFVIMDYSFSRKEKVLLPYQLFRKAWQKTGYTEMIVIKK